MRLHSQNPIRIVLAAAIVLSAAAAINSVRPVFAGEIGSDDFQISTAQGPHSLCVLT